MKRFLRTDGPRARMYCRDLPQSTHMVPAPNGEVTAVEITYYKRTHTCGPPSDPWDVAPEGNLQPKGKAS